ncbi:hypothetical protein [Paenibacillus sp. FSL M7-1046]|uniref:hypothetical protein n=1 Tax=Paenibacillus sp. FSL M7-1046 TaxID=2975315 RepID=UPI0030F62A5D
MEKIGILMIFLFMVTTNVFAEPVQQRSLEGFLNNDLQLLTLSAQEKVVINRMDNSISVFNLASGEEAWTKSYSKLYDVDVLSSPEKIIVIAKDKDKDNKLQKIVLSKEGTTLSTTVFNSAPITKSITSNEEMINWYAPEGSNKERLSVYSNNVLAAYQAPWNNPVFKMNLGGMSSSKYEDITLKDIKLNGPYAVVKYTGYSLMQSQDFFRVINTSNKKKTYTIASDWNTRSDSSFAGNELVINSSFNVGNPLGVNVGQPYSLSGMYNLSTGKKTAGISETFTEREMGWKSERIGNHILIYLPEKGRIDIYNLSGRKVSEASITLPNSFRVLDYSKGELSLLIREETGATIQVIHTTAIN